MSKIDYATLAMFRNVYGVLLKFQPLINAIPAFAAFLIAFGAKLKKLEELATQYGAEDGDAGGEKNEKRQALCAAIYDLTGPLFIFAVNTNNIELKGKVDYTLNKLEKIAVGRIAAIADQVHKLAFDNANPLADYGVTPAMLVTLKTAIEDYNNVQDLPRETKDERAAIGQQIQPLIKEIRELLKTNGDLFIKRFQASEPSFYYEYEQAREIVDPKVNHTELKGVVVSAADGTPIYQAKVSLVGSNLSVDTGADGSYVMRLEPGTHSFTIRHHAFDGKEVIGLRVKLGQAVKVDAELAPMG
ncbi:MAG: hypothetical protein JWP69_1945 [Flaviaesturariibacter sp.]|nr:hypothetical protein [Flaviaesturariibacter sp.]